MMRKLLPLFVFLYMLSGWALAAEEGGDFVYNDGGKRDPFMALISPEGTVGTGTAGVESIDDITLEGIVWDPSGGSFAIVNGEILKENEQVNNVKITDISPNAIVILINNNVYTINLVQEEGE